MTMEEFCKIPGVTEAVNCVVSDALGQMTDHILDHLTQLDESGKLMHEMADRAVFMAVLSFLATFLLTARRVNGPSWTQESRLKCSNDIAQQVFLTLMDDSILESTDPYRVVDAAHGTKH